MQELVLFASYYQYCCYFRKGRTSKLQMVTRDHIWAKSGGKIYIYLSLETSCYRKNLGEKYQESLLQTQGFLSLVSVKISM